MPPKALQHLVHIIESADLIAEYVGESTFDDYLADIKLRDSVERRFTIIGGALKRRERDHPSLHAKIDHTRAITAFRNIVVHVCDMPD